MRNHIKNHAAIILRNKDKVLFVQRSATKKILPNIWAVPSGTVEEGEKIESTIKREALEELGVNITIEKLLTTVDLPEFKVRLHFFVCTSKPKKPTICDPNEIQSLRWMTFTEFFDKYNDDQIGHGLVYLRKHPEIWKKGFL